MGSYQAGLFAAVIVPFTVESYKWLQEDPAETSAAYLKQISSQLSSFVVSSALINSTTSFTPVVQSPASRISVHINRLWFLSLTLSLVSAFFSLTVLQWLRQLSIPRYLSTRNAARLRQWRWDALLWYQVPSIITFLPLLIQIAVVLFMIGLGLLIGPLDPTVAVTFGVFAAAGVAFFAWTTILPLWSPQIPYKSPVIPTTISVLQWIASIVLRTLYAVFMFFEGIILAISWGVWLCWGRAGEAVGNAWDAISDKLRLQFRKLIKLATPRVRRVGLGRFWPDRETAALTHDGSPDELDASALSSAITAASGKDLTMFIQVFKAQKASYRMRCLVQVMAYTIGFHFDLGHDRNRTTPFSQSGETNFARVRERASHLTTKELALLLRSAHKGLFVGAFPCEDEPGEEKILWRQNEAAPSMLLLFHLATMTGHVDEPSRPTVLDSIASVRHTLLERLTLDNPNRAAVFRPSSERWVLTLLLCHYLHGLSTWQWPDECER